MYPLLRDLLFCISPEKAHYFSMNCLQEACNFEILKQAIRKHFSYDNPSLERNVFGLHFKNPVGLGAGFDKNAAYLRELSTLGFGIVAVGTITPKAQLGNLKPRLFRLPKDQALINRMGFNNDGVETIKQRLLQWNNYKSKNGGSPIIVGGNIGKNKITPNETAYRDYEICFTELFDYVDYFVVNVSSPNTPGLRELQEKAPLMDLLHKVQAVNKALPNPKPVLLKIAPDLTDTQLDDIIEIVAATQIDGIVATNTTIDRSQLQTPAAEVEAIGAGGLSGKPVTARSTEVIRYIHQKTNGTIPMIAVGGIFTAADAIEKLNAGASLVQVYTGFIYEGPGMVKRICNGLLQQKNN